MHRFLLILFSSLLMASASGQSGLCDSTDFAILCQDADLVNSTVFDCGLSCFTSSVPACFTDCYTAVIPTMSAGCVSCFESQTSCVSDNCLFTCAFGSTEDCAACVAANCGAAYVACAGIVDADEDGESIVCDCDDTDPTRYTGAPGTGQGIDNNCDGVLSAEEAQAGCPEDLNGDGLVSVADILSVLSEFGCTSACTQDLNGDDAVTVGDILLVLSAFGNAC